MGETLDYMSLFAQFPFALRHFLQYRLTLAQAQEIIRRNMARRAENFLLLVEHGIYAFPRSPYLPLLHRAGCELGDLRGMVQREGLEATLLALRKADVYITFEELKGRKPITRGDFSRPVHASDFDNPGIKSDLTVQTGGTTGAATRVGINLHDVAARAPYLIVLRAAHNAHQAPTVRWDGLLPSTTFRSTFQMITLGQKIAHWFTPERAHDLKNSFKYDLASYYILFWLRAFGVSIPLPQRVLPDQAIVVARAIEKILREQRECFLITTVSRALRVASAAKKAGIDLRGASVCGYAEAVTSPKVQPILDSGAKFFATYSMVEANLIGGSCVCPRDVTDVHLFKDAFALFSYPIETPGVEGTVPALTLTTLLPTSAKLMLNVQIDDCGIVEERECGCALEQLGYTTHVREIRSYSKLVGEGVTLLGNELVSIIESVLPARFGGSALDYQLLEQEDVQGYTRLFLVIHPRIKVPDEQLALDLVWQAMRRSSSAADVARSIWQPARTIQIKRMEPISTAAGKHLPLYIQRRHTISQQASS